MKRFEQIKKGFEVNTFDGYFVADSYNGSIVFGTEYYTDENGDVYRTDDRMLTLTEIAHLMREFDGQNHMLVWED